MNSTVADTIIIAITAFLIGALITLVVGLSSYGSNIQASGQNNIQGGITTLEDGQFSIYDNTQVNGQIVKTAIGLYSTEPISIIVRNARHINSSTVFARNYGALMDIPGMYSGTDPDEIGTIMGTTNTVLGTGITGRINADFNTNTSGVIKRNNQISNITKAGNIEEISTSAMYQSSLMIDGTNEISGIYFVQVIQ